MRVLDLYWAAGFLEGEGSFTSAKRRGDSLGHDIKISAGQNQREPLDRLKMMFGGNVYVYAPKKEGAQSFHHWHLCGKAAAAVMMTLWSLMSPRRRDQIEKTLALWVGNPKWKPLQGELNPSAKLNWQKVGEIRSSSEGTAALAAKYGVARNTIQKIRQGALWRSQGS